MEPLANISVADGGYSHELKRKLCTKCKLQKFLTEFYPSQVKRVSSWCISCIKEYQHTYNAKQKLRQRAKQYYAKKKEATVYTPKPEMFCPACEKRLLKYLVTKFI